MTKEEAIEKVREMKLSPGKDAELIIALHTLIPELAESEDERITRAINNMLPFIPDEAYANNGVTKEGVLNWLEKQGEQKPAESEQNPLVKMLEDKKAITEDIRNGIPTKIIEKERNVKFATPVDVSHVEWSEEDEQMLTEVINDIKCGTDFNIEFQAAANKRVKWLKGKLKHLRPCPSWKPSEHQMTILKAVKEYVGRGSGYWGEALGSLIEDLEKLM